MRKIKQKFLAVFLGSLVFTGCDVLGIEARKEEEMLDEDISALILRNMVMEEQIFYYSLLTHQPDMTIDKASALLDTAIAEYGSEEVSELTTKLIENFTQRGDEPKKKMVMRMG